MGLGGREARITNAEQRGVPYANTRSGQVFFTHPSHTQKGSRQDTRTRLCQIQTDVLSTPVLRPLLASRTIAERHTHDFIAAYEPGGKRECHVGRTMQLGAYSRASGFGPVDRGSTYSEEVGIAGLRPGTGPKAR